MSFAVSWETICHKNDIVANSGRAALIDGEQVAIFRVSLDGSEQYFALANYCPFSHANVISRGIVGSLDGRLVVASPIYKEHFDLQTGVCLEDDSVVLQTWAVQLDGDQIQVATVDEEVAV
ncbi:Nitrite reductase (NADH) small subunit [BD1-7 clade bacterium]|uniref:Nitrite reductase (NADH) small subunit n=1 Tax=BD1-7 clade bacterium TaxID=2029982 RepID=A0A5S9PMT9_9GAMM|nr:Nitrite reductase (NADH) small subunit [BD1-7 clade bacterium]CAA0105303.1 Nitrite reductase (NADH) small subunit [BD1-7 clade bacterium]